MISWLASAVALIVTQAPETLTYYHAAAPAPAVIKALAEKTGKPMSCAPALASRVILVSVKDVPMSDVFDRIATATGGEWILEGSGKRFLRPSAKNSASEQQQFLERKAAITKAIEKYRKLAATAISNEQALTDSKKVEDFSKASEAGSSDYTDYVKVQEATGRLPEGRLRSAVFSMLDARQLASILPGGRMVFAGQPTRMQEKVQISPILAAIAQYNQECLSIASARRKADGISDNPELLNKTDPDHDEKYSRYFGVDSIDANNISNLFVVVERQESQYSSSNLSLSLRVFFKGTEWPRTFEDEIDFEGLDATAEDQSNFETLVKLSPGEQKFELTGDSKIISGWLNNGNLDKAKDNPELFAKVMRPDMYDPLSFGTSDVLKFWVEQEKANFIGEIPEILLMLGMGEMTAQYSIPKFMKWAGKAGFLTVGREGDWLTLDSGPQFRRVERVDRVALSRFMAGIAREGRASFELLAGYVAGGGRFDMMGTGVWVRMAGKSDLPYLDTNAMRALRLYGTLTQSQRETLKNGNALAYANLSSVSKAFAHLLVYGAQPVLISATSEPTVSESESGDEDYEGSRPDLEPTILVPNGIENNAQIRLVPGDKPLLYTYESATQGPSEGWGQSPKSVGASAFYQTRPDLFPWVRDNRPREFFRLGNSTTFRFEIQPAVGVVARSTFRDQRVTSVGDAVRFEALPAEIRALFKKGYSEAEEQNKNVQPGDYNSGRTPKKNIP